MTVTSLIILLLIINRFLLSVSQYTESQSELAETFPFFAQLILQEGDQRKICSATIIHPKALLTAAHCFPIERHQIAKVEKEEACVAHTGYNLTDRKWMFSDTVRKIHRHENYSGIPFDPSSRDIAVAKLRRGFKLNDYVYTISLPVVNETHPLSDECTGGTVVGIADSSNNTVLMYAPAGAQVKKSVDLLFVLKGYASRLFLEMEFDGASGGPYFCYRTYGHIPVQHGVVLGSLDVEESNISKTLLVVESVAMNLDFISNLVLLENVFDDDTKFLKRRSNFSLFMRSEGSKMVHLDKLWFIYIFCAITNRS